MTKIVEQDPWVRPIEFEVEAASMSRPDLPLMLALAQQTFPPHVPHASGIADERPGHVTHYWTPAGPTQPTGIPDTSGDYDLGQ